MSAGTQPQAESLGNFNSREKYWKELSIEQKQERTREILKQKISELEFLTDVIYKLKRQFEAHSHQESSIVIPINTNDNEKMMNIPLVRRRLDNGSSNPDEVYF